MEKRFRVVALSSLMTAMAVVMTAFGGIFPNMSLSLAALAGLCPQVSLLAGGRRAALMTYAASALLCLLTGAAGESGLLYACLFGLYPVVKNQAERCRGRARALAVKFVYANGALGLLVGLSLLFAPELFQSEASLWILWLVYEVLFLLYDHVLGAVSRLLVSRLKIDKRG